MKKNYKIVLAFVLGILISGSSVYAATKYLASDVTYKDITVEEALNELYSKLSSSCDESLVGFSWTYDYSGAEEILVIPCNGIYKLETWGAQGGTINTTYIGGYGGYSIGHIKLTASNKLFINVGGKGNSGANSTKAGGYNGGGIGQSTYSGAYYSSGGGATHIATTTGLLSNISDKKEKILIVSGGGGGSWYQTSGFTILQTGGHGGGYIGNPAVGTSNVSPNTLATGGTQLTGGKNGSFNSSIDEVSGLFGYGGDRLSTCGSGGGGGYYGGGASNCAAGGGGSGFIGTSKLTSYNNIEKAMYCYNCEESDKENTKTISTTNVSEEPISNYAKKGNGYAKITLVSLK